MPVSPDFHNFVLDQLSGLVPNEKRMFGGIGLFVDGLMFGIISGSDVLYLKADAVTVAEVTAAGGVPMQYTRAGKSRSMSYYTVPADILDDPDLLRVWADNAIAVAHRAATDKRKSGTARGKPIGGRTAERPSRSKSAKK